METQERAVVARLLIHIEDLTKIATGELRHSYNGDCPDQNEGPNVRDPDCPACQVLLAAITPAARPDEG